MEQIKIAGYEILLERKAVKHLHLSVVPPRGQLRVTAPLQASRTEIEAFITGNLDWIRVHTAQFQQNSHRPPHRYRSGETIRIFGQPLVLQVEYGLHYRAQQSGGRLLLTVPDNAFQDTRRQVIQDWYAGQLEQALPPLIQRWEGGLGVHATRWKIHAMSSRWGSCNRKTGAINLNLRLAAMPKEFLEYVVVHELCHFHVGPHNQQFWALVASCLPDWQDRRRRLNAYYEDQFAD